MSLQSTRSSISNELAKLRSLNNHDKVKVPITMVSDLNPDDMILVKGEWIKSPWENMIMMLTDVDEHTQSQTLHCKTTDAVDCKAHKHDGYLEEVHILSGTMYDKAHNVTLHAGGRIKYNAGEVHWPDFPGPASFIVIFRKVE